MSLQKIGAFLVEADLVCDKVWLVSTCTNLFNIALKAALWAIGYFKRNNNPANPYLCHLKGKSFKECACLLVPVIGNHIVKRYLEDFRLSTAIANPSSLRLRHFKDLTRSKAFTEKVFEGWQKKLDENFWQNLKNFPQPFPCLTNKQVIFDLLEEIPTIPLYADDALKNDPQYIKDLKDKVSSEDYLLKQGEDVWFILPEEVVWDFTFAKKIIEIYPEALVKWAPAFEKDVELRKKYMATEEARQAFTEVIVSAIKQDNGLFMLLLNPIYGPESSVVKACIVAQPELVNKLKVSYEVNGELVFQSIVENRKLMQKLEIEWYDTPLPERLLANDAAFFQDFPEIFRQDRSFLARLCGGAPLLLQKLFEETLAKDREFVLSCAKYSYEHNGGVIDLGDYSPCLDAGVWKYCDETLKEDREFRKAYLKNDPRVVEFNPFVEFIQDRDVFESIFNQLILEGLFCVSENSLLAEVRYDICLSALKRCPGKFLEDQNFIIDCFDKLNSPKSASDILCKFLLTVGPLFLAEDLKSFAKQIVQKIPECINGVFDAYSTSDDDFDIQLLGDLGPEFINNMLEKTLMREKEIKNGLSMLCCQWLIENDHRCYEYMPQEVQKNFIEFEMSSYPDLKERLFKCLEQNPQHISRISREWLYSLLYKKIILKIVMKVPQCFPYVILHELKRTFIKSLVEVRPEWFLHAPEKLRKDMELMEYLLSNSSCRQVIAFADEEVQLKVLEKDPACCMGIKRWSEPIFNMLILQKRRVIPALPKDLWKKIYLLQIGSAFAGKQSVIF